ncbi:hypothetical protein LguiA_004563 [Lonicera macranthoides]
MRTTMMTTRDHNLLVFRQFGPACSQFYSNSKLFNVSHKYQYPKQLHPTTKSPWFLAFSAERGRFIIRLVSLSAVVIYSLANSTKCKMSANKPP